MNKLVAVNQILPALGERPVTALTNQHPTVAIIEAALQGELDSLLLEPQGWWFNTYRQVLYPNTRGEIELPDNLVSATRLPHMEAGAARGKRWYSLERRSYLWDAPQELELRERWEFEDLPESAARLVMYQALVNTYLKDLGLEQVVNAWMGYAQDARAAFEAENLRNLNLASRQGRRYRFINRARWGQ